MDFFLVILKQQGGPKSDEIWRIFRPHPQTFCSHARMRQNIVILKNLLSTDGCSTRKRVSMLYFANVYLFIYLFSFFGRFILRPWLTEVRESFTRGGS